MIVDKSQLPFATKTVRTDTVATLKGGTASHVIETYDVSEFDSKLLAYLGARAVHKYTVGEPAPWPEHEFLRTLAESIERGEPLELTHLEQFNNDWTTAIAVDSAAPAAAVDSPTLWSRMVDAFNVLTGKVTV